MYLGSNRGEGPYESKATYFRTVLVLKREERHVVSHLYNPLEIKLNRSENKVAIVDAVKAEAYDLEGYTIGGTNQITPGVKGFRR